MAGERLGPFRLEARLGAGGMGTAWRAVAEESAPGIGVGERVVVKILHPHLAAEPTARARFRREAAAGVRILHENVAATLLAGEDESGGEPVSYIVTRYVEGRDLRALLDEMRAVPEALLREIAAQVADGLSAIHDAGVVHRDLKPENVLVTHDFRIRIVDLGVARVLDASAILTLEGEFTGSLPYAAPEQFMAGPVGPAADLYSLGVVLYELASGANPFARERVAEIVGAHLREQPPPLRARNPEISEFLSAAVATLLEKAPAGRFPSAGALRDALRAGESSGWWAARCRESPAAGADRPAVPVRRDSPLTARDREIGRLRELFALARDGRGATVLVEGEEGIGKSRLVDALIESAEGQGHLLYGSFREDPGGRAIDAAILDHFAAADLEAGLRTYLPDLAALAPTFADSLVRRTPETGAPALTADARAAVICALARGLAAERPLLWVVEDLESAEPADLRLVLSLANAVAKSPALLVLTALPSLSPDARARLARLPRFLRIELARLDRDAMEDLVRAAFPDTRSAGRISDILADECDGVPFVAVEILRAMRERGGAEPPGGETLLIPASVRDAMRARLEGIGESEREILDLAAVIGIAFPPDLVARALGRSNVEVLRRLAVLERGTGIVRCRGRSMRFDHSQLREVLLSELPPGLAAEYHRMVADSLLPEERSDAGSGEIAWRLADHLLAAGAATDAAPRIAPGLRFLEAHQRFEAVADLARRALALPGAVDGGERIGLRLRWAAALNILGRKQEEAAVLDEALAEAAGRGPEEATVRTAIGRHLLSVGRPEEARACLMVAAALARDAGDAATEGAATGLIGGVLWGGGKYEEAALHIRAHLEISRRTGDRIGESNASGNLGLLALYSGRYEEARAHFDRQFEVARSAGHRVGEASATGAIGIVLHEQGRAEEALERYEAAIRISREIGFRTGETNYRGNLGNLLCELGRFEESARQQERSLDLARELGDRNEEARLTGNIGNVRKDMGELGEAERLYRRGLEMAAETGNARAELWGQLNLGMLLVSVGDLEAAEAAIGRGEERSREIGERRAEALAASARALLAEARGHLAEAERRHRDSLRIRREIGDDAAGPGILLSLGRVAAEAGRTDEAISLLRESLAAAEEHGLPGTAVLARCRLAGLDRSEAEAARLALAGHGARLGRGDRMEAHHLLARATGDLEHAAAARRDLEALLASVPEDRRAAMVERVPLCRAIARGPVSG